MIEYSKEGYLKDDYRIFHISDTATRNFSYHYHDFYKILIFLRGDVTYHIEGKAYELQPYDIVLVSAGEIHCPVINSHCVYERIILYISPAFMETFQEKDTDLSLCFKQARASKSNVLRIALFHHSRLYHTLIELKEAFSKDAFAGSLYRQVLFLEFMILLNRSSMDQYGSSYIENNSPDSRVVPILEYINEHLTEELSVDSLASRFYLSRYYLMHLFKQETGCSVASYISTKRLLLARTLIHNGHSVTDACYQCGFKNYSTFSRAYKKLFHTSAKNK